MCPKFKASRVWSWHSEDLPGDITCGSEAIPPSPLCHLTLTIQRVATPLSLVLSFLLSFVDMLSPALGRVVLSAPTKSTPAALATHSYLSSRITAASPSLPPLRRTHQRRYSSSNPSCPPGRSKSATPQSASNNSSSKPGKRKSKEPATSQANNQPFSNFPSVPSTKHLSVRGRLSCLSVALTVL